jgi:hypothetical protein
MILNYTYYKRKLYFSKTTLLTVTKHNRLLSILVPHNTYRLTFASAKPLCLRCTTSFFIRHMWKTPLNGVHQVTKNGVLALGKFTTPHSVGNRNMSFLRGGTAKKKLPVTVLDDSGKHKIVTETTCNKPGCLSINCADKQNTDKCLNESNKHQQNTVITPSNIQFETRAVGNLTSKIPFNKPGCIVSFDTNYKGDAKAQEMVIEPNPPIINPGDLKTDKLVTTYVQEPKHHEFIINALRNKHHDT